MLTLYASEAIFAGNIQAVSNSYRARLLKENNFLGDRLSFGTLISLAPILESRLRNLQKTSHEHKSIHRGYRKPGVRMVQVSFSIIRWQIELR